MLRQGPRLDIFRSKLFKRLAGTYLLLLLVCVVIVSATFRTVYESYRSRTIDSGRASLENVAGILETRFLELEAIARQISLDPRVRLVLQSRHPLEENDYYRLFEARKALAGYPVTNQFMESMFVFSPASDLLVGAGFATARADLMYYAAIGYEGLDFRGFREELLSRGSMYVSFGRARDARPGLGRVAEYVSLHVPIRRYGSNEDVAFVIMLIPKSRIQQVVEAAGFGSGTYWSLESSLGDVIAFAGIPGLHEAASGGSRSVVLFETTSPVYGLRYTGVHPTAVFADPLNRVRTSFLFSILSVIAISTIAALWFSYRNSKPVARIVEKIRCRCEGERDAADLKGEYDIIERALLRLADSADEMSQRMDHYRPILEARYKDLLFRKGMYWGAEMRSLREHLDMDLGTGTYVVLVAQLGGFFTEMSVRRLYDVEQQRAAFLRIIDVVPTDVEVVVHTVDPDKVAVLLILVDPPGDHDTTARAYAKEVVEQSARLGLPRVRIGIGRTCRDPGGIQQSYLEAMDCLDFAAISEADSVVHSADRTNDCELYWYPVDLEEKILQFIKMGDREQPLLLLQNLVDLNLQRHSLPSQMIDRFVAGVQGTIYRACAYLPPDDPDTRVRIVTLVDNLRSATDITHLESYLERILRLMTGSINEAKRSRNSRLAKEIVSYLDHHYAEVDLSVTKIATRFALTDTYLSHFFKEQTGESLSAYLEKTRMRHASRALSESESNVLTIALQVGYWNVNTFYKAFKRVHGVTPSTYRKRMLGEPVRIGAD